MDLRNLKLVKCNRGKINLSVHDIVAVVELILYGEHQRGAYRSVKLTPSWQNRGLITCEATNNPIL